MTSSLLNLYPSFCLDEILIRPHHSDIQSRGDISLGVKVAKAPEIFRT